ncbi:MAG: hypothetical protein KKH22_12560, partial [Proteobacteria bacterium]|nr:hypothetical protein [Pseudomonadota bacterium]
MPDQQHGATEQTTEQQITGLFNCHQKNPFSCLIRKALDTGITGKLLGMLIVSLLGFTLIIAQNTYSLHKIEKLTNNIKDENIPQYKVSQYILRSLNGFKISLIHLLNQKNVTADDKNILANHQRLETLERMVLAMKDGGTIMDVAKVSQKTMDIITIAPARSPEMTTLVNEIIAEFTALDTNFNELVDSLTQQPGSVAANTYTEDVVGNLDELHNLVTDLAITVNDSYNHNLKETAATIKDSQFKLYLTSSIIAVILFVGTILYILLIVVPLKDILAKIKQIAKEEGTLSQRIEVHT